MNDMSPIHPLPTDVATLSALEIAPENPRSSESVSLEEIMILSENIQIHGVLTPLICYQAGDTYFVTAGGRRLRALRQLAQSQDVDLIPILCTDKVNAITMGAAEQLSHIKMTAADELRIYAQPYHSGRAPRDLAKITGRSVRYVLQRLEVLRLPQQIVDAIMVGRITVEQACGLTYFAGDETRLTELFEMCLSRPNLGGDELRELRLREVSQWDKNPATAYVSREAYLAAGGRLQEDLFTDATLILSPSVMKALACTTIQSQLEETFQGAAFIRRLDDDGNVWAFPSHRGLEGGTQEQRDWLDENPRWRIPIIDTERLTEHASISEACERKYPKDLLALLGVVWKYSAYDKDGCTVRCHVLPDDLTPLYDAGYLERPSTDETGSGQAEIDEAAVSAVLGQRIARIKVHALRMDLASRPDAVIGLYLSHLLGHQPGTFRQRPEAADQPDDFLRCEPGAAFVRLLDFDGITAEGVEGLKPADQRRALTRHLLDCLTPAYGVLAVDRGSVRKYWAPDADFLTAYKRPALAAMVNAIDTAAAKQLEGSKKVGLAEYLATAAQRDKTWLPAGF